MGFIHIDCLREWLSNKRQRRVGEYVTTYCWKNLDCELCHTKFPNVLEVVRRDSKSGLNVVKKISLIDLQVPDTASEYLVLESVTQQNIKIIHIIDFSH
jgi:hypothetical protein